MPNSCRHDHLRFEDGALHIVCVGCDKVWGSLVKKGGGIDYTAMTEASTMLPHDTRHNRWSTPRDHKKLPK